MLLPLFNAKETGIYQWLFVGLTFPQQPLACNFQTHSSHQGSSPGREIYDLQWPIKVIPNLQVIFWGISEGNPSLKLSMSRLQLTCPLSHQRQAPMTLTRHLKVKPWGPIRQLCGYIKHVPEILHIHHCWDTALSWTLSHNLFCYKEKQK